MSAIDKNLSNDSADAWQTTSMSLVALISPLILLANEPTIKYGIALFSRAFTRSIIVTKGSLRVGGVSITALFFYNPQFVTKLSAVVP
jgi:hypothetical protein